MNNFIVGQVTPDMLENLRYGTYIFFGLLTFGGAAFIWIFFPEVSVLAYSPVIWHFIQFNLKMRPCGVYTNTVQTKGLSLEEMDLIFGSVGFAAADEERMREINVQVGLEDAVRGTSISHDVKEKPTEKDAESD